MMHEIIIKGKTYDGMWVEGAYYHAKKYYGDPDDKHCIIPTAESLDYEQALEYFIVDPATVGRYTGLKDRDGKRIFEGDIVKAQDDLIFSPFCDGLVGKVVYSEAAFFIEPKDPTKSEYLFNECAVYEVLGNIHDNPELMEVR